MQPAGFGIRLLARTIDTVVYLVAAFAGGLLGTLLAIALGHNPRAMTNGSRSFALEYLLSFLMILALNTASEGIDGASPGKLACGLRVLTVDRRPCTIGRALGRNLAFLVDSLFCGLVGYLSMSGSPMYQRNGDKWAGTIVVRASTVPAAARRTLGPGILVGVTITALLATLLAVKMKL